MSKNKLIYKNDGTVDYNSLEEIISIVSERAIEVIDDSLYELIGKDEDNPDEFYEDYMECLPHILKNISEFQNKINEED